MSFTVLSAAYHRNGVFGTGFFVGLIHDHEVDRKLLITWFPDYSDPGNEVLATSQTRIAVIDPAEAAGGNVHMHPQDGRPGNAWRGDLYGDAARAIRTEVHRHHDQLLGRTS